MNIEEYKILYEVYASSGLGKWFKEKWKDISRKKKGGGHPSCGASAGKGTRAKDSSKKYPKCVPASKAKSMSKKEKQSAVRRKRQKPNQPGKPDFVNTKLKKEELNLLEYQMKLDNLLEFLMEEKLSEQTALPAVAGTGTPAGDGLMMNPAVPAPPAGAAVPVPPAGAAVLGAPPAPGAAGTVSAPQGSTASSVIITPAAVQPPTQQPVPGQSATTLPVAAPAGGLSPLPPPLAEDLSALTEEQLLEILTSEKLDPVGHEDSDINNDGIENDRTDDYLRHRREVRSKAIKSSLSESVKYQELQNQERRRKSLIKVQNKIIYAKK